MLEVLSHISTRLLSSMRSVDEAPLIHILKMSGVGAYSYFSRDVLVGFAGYVKRGLFSTLALNQGL